MNLCRPMACRAALLALVSACGSTLPRAELDRCNRGSADGNDAFQVRQGAACRMVAARLIADDRSAAAAGYARMACQLEDAHGCEQYLALVRGQPDLMYGELPRARAAGEKACAGMVVDAEGTDARAGICARLAELYFDLEPHSRPDAGRLWARACALGDEKSCARARKLGVEPEAGSFGAKGAAPVASPLKRAEPPPATPPPPAGCHEMRACVGLDVHRRSGGEVVGTLTNHCGAAVSCTWCPARGDQIDKEACHWATLAPDEAKVGREAGLFYVGYTAIAYDCMDATDARACIGM